MIRTDSVSKFSFLVENYSGETWDGIAVSSDGTLRFQVQEAPVLKRSGARQRWEVSALLNVERPEVSTLQSVIQVVSTGTRSAFSNASVVSYRPASGLLSVPTKCVFGSVEPGRLYTENMKLLTLASMEINANSLIIHCVPGEMIAAEVISFRGRACELKVDFRAPQSYQQKSVSGSLNISLSDLPQKTLLSIPVTANFK